MDEGRFRLSDPHSRVQLCVHYSHGVNDNKELMLIYSGAAEALIAAGVAPASCSPAVSRARLDVTLTAIVQWFTTAKAGCSCGFGRALRLLTGYQE